MTYILAVICSVAVLAADQISKLLVVNNYEQLIGGFPIIKNLINFTYVQNGGAAFGMFNSKKWLIIAVTVIIIVMCIGLLIKKSFSSKTMFWAICLVLAGGVGNLIDRIFRNGYVVDFIQFDFFKSFPVFNIADIAVCVGAGLILLCFIVDFVNESKQGKKSERPKDNADRDE